MSNSARPANCDGSDSESSSDGQMELDRLREAANNEFISDSLFNRDKVKEIGKCSKKSSESCSSIQAPQVSLRTQDNDQQYNGIYVTPEFQKYVSKHLSKVLDSQIKEKTKKLVTKTMTPVTAGGVKLFRDSTEYISATPEPTAPPRRRVTKRKRDSSSSSSESERARFSEAAVSSDWVTSKECMKGWTKLSKGKEIVVNGYGELTGKKREDLA